jgi:hypothetical protein
LTKSWLLEEAEEYSLGEEKGPWSGDSPSDAKPNESFKGALPSGSGQPRLFLIPFLGRTILAQVMDHSAPVEVDTKILP